MANVLMKCGHATAATNVATGAPVCIICVGISPNAMVVEDSPPDLSDRKMRCSYIRGRDGKPCHARENPRPSSPQAAFFSHKPTAEFDEFYCGCWGWD